MFLLASKDIFLVFDCRFLLLKKIFILFIFLFWSDIQFFYATNEFFLHEIDQCLALILNLWINIFIHVINFSYLLLLIISFSFFFFTFSFFLFHPLLLFFSLFFTVFLIISLSLSPNRQRSNRFDCYVNTSSCRCKWRRNHSWLCFIW